MKALERHREGLQERDSVRCVRERERAAVLLDPLRLEILERAREPRSASRIAEELGLPRQRVNYHVRELAEAGFLELAAERRRRNFIEQLYRTTARAFLVSPEVLGPMAAERLARDTAAADDDAGAETSEGADGERPAAVDLHSADYLLALTARVQSEVARGREEAVEEGRRLATLSLSADLRFTDPDQRRRFAGALRDAVAAVIAEHAAPERADDGGPAPGRPYRLTVGCHPVPREVSETTKGDGNP